MLSTINKTTKRLSIGLLAEKHSLTELRKELGLKRVRRAQQLIQDADNLQYVKRIHAPPLTGRRKLGRLGFAESYHNYAEECTKAILNDEIEFRLMGRTGLTTTSKTP